MAGIATTVNLTPTQSTDALFRAWGSGVSAKFGAAGWVQTADSGQINWTTVLKPAGTSASQGYEIWRMADTLQATAPIFIKIEYGSNAGSATHPAIWLTFGTGSDGAGTLTGPVSVRKQLQGTDYATNALTCYISGDTNRIMMALFVQGTGASSSNSMFFAIERTKDSAGADTNQGLLVLWKLTAGNTMGQLFWDRTTGTPTGNPEASLGAMGNESATAKNGTQVAVFPFFLSNLGIFVNPPLNAMGYINADIVAFGAVTFSVYGVSHTYMPLGNTPVAGSTIVIRTTGSACLLVRYDTLTP